MFHLYKCRFCGKRKFKNKINTFDIKERWRLDVNGWSKTIQEINGSRPCQVMFVNAGAVDSEEGTYFGFCSKQYKDRNSTRFGHRIQFMKFCLLGLP